MNIEMIIFDMDGVIFEGDNFWLDLHKAYGTMKEAFELAKQYLHTTRESDYIYLSNYTANRLWKGKPASDYYQLIKERKYHPGIHKLFHYIHNRNIKTAIISSGAYELAVRAQEELEIDKVFANQLHIDNSILSGEVDVNVPDNKKQNVGKKLMHEYNIKPNNVGFIGDTESDITLATIVDLPISYNTQSQNLRKVCKFNLNYGEIEKVIDILDDSSQTDLKSRVKTSNATVSENNLEKFNWAIR